MEGNFGLARTYWIFGVLVGFLVGWLVENFWLGLLYWFIAIPYLFYWIAVSIGVWNAASKYRDNPWWGVLAQTSVILGFLATAYDLYDAISALLHSN